MIENIENKPFTRLFEDRIWSKLAARRSMLYNPAPDGTALPVPRPGYPDMKTVRADPRFEKLMKIWKEVARSSASTGS